MSVGADSFVFKFTTQKYKDQDIQKYNSAVVLCGRESWSRTIKEERRLTLFKNWVLRKTFGPKKGLGNRGMEKTT